MMHRQRKAFSLLTAVFLIIIMSGISMYVMTLSGKIVNETTTQYKKEQAMLLAKSYTELAIMTTMSNDRNGTNNCITDIDANVGHNDPDGSGQGYRVRTRISYIGAQSDIQVCANTRELDYPAPLDPGPPIIENDELNIIVDVYVEYKDVGQEDIDNSPWITYHRRTLQKI